MKQILTNSSLTTFKTCPRKYQFRYEMGMAPVRESDPLYFGKLIHFGLDKWSKGLRNIAGTLDAVTQEFGKSDNKDEYVLARAAALLEGYHSKYKDEPYSFVFSEGKFNAPLLNPLTSRESKTFELGMVLDRIVEDLSGRRYLIETKTTSEDIEDPNSDYWHRLGIDSQISTYYYGAEINGYKIESCIYDVIRKPTIRPKQVGKDVDSENPKREETPQEYYERLSADIKARPNFYFARKVIPRSETDIKDYLFDVYETSKVLRSFQLSGKFPRFIHSCRGNFGYCEYFSVCSGRASFHDQTLFKKNENKHVELGGNK